MIRVCFGGVGGGGGGGGLKAAKNVIFFGGRGGRQKRASRGYVPYQMGGRPGRIGLKHNLLRF